MISYDEIAGLSLNLDAVPKCLGHLVYEWAPSACVISFKLETDDTILERKATGAIKKYGVYAVIANVLQTRRDKVTVFRAEYPPVRTIVKLDPEISSSEIYKLQEGDTTPTVLEKEIVSTVKHIHVQWAEERAWERRPQGAKPQPEDDDDFDLTGVCPFTGARSSYKDYEHGSFSHGHAMKKTNSTWLKVFCPNTLFQGGWIPPLMMLMLAGLSFLVGKKKLVF